MINSTKRIGVIFTFKSRWIGGIYYIINVVNSFNYLNEENKPEVVIFYNDRTEKYLSDITYSKSIFKKIEVDYSVFIYFKSLFLNRNYFFSSSFVDFNLDVLFPFNDYIGALPKIRPKVFSWIPDFQHKYYPQYFSKLNLILREFKFKMIARNCNGLVFSSHDAFSQFKSFYKYPKELIPNVVRFTSIVDFENLITKEEVFKKFKIQSSYFIICNQFYQHKNHLLILKALKLIVEKGGNCHIIFTGKPDQVKDNIILDEMNEYMDKNFLNKNVEFLGLLPRMDQLSLILYSDAVIQPSKFEGWSTVIEDAKSLNKLVLASNLSVNIEQLNEKALYFSPDSDEELSNAMLKVLNKEINLDIKWEPQNIRTKVFAESLLKAFDS
jgi:glycosyltransferase involved in cell wall biosynthesis